MRLSALDALNFYYCQAATDLESGDMCSVIAVDSGNASPSFAEIRDALTARIALIPALQERIALAPGKQTFPHWVTDPQPAADKITEAISDSWSGVLDFMIEASVSRINPLESAWRATVWRNVSGVPDVDDQATVVFMQVSHAITDGQGITQVQRALFGDDSALAKIPGHGNPTAKLGLRQPVAELLTLPFNLIRSISPARKAFAGPKPNNGYTIVGVAELNKTGQRRAYIDVRMIPLSSLKWAGTVTETGLTAVSAALENYLTKLGVTPGDLYAQVPVVPPGASTLEVPVPSGNTVSSAVLVDLGIGSDTRTARHATIQASFRSEMANHAGPGHLAKRQFIERLPLQIIRASALKSVGVAPHAVPSHTSLTSYTKGKADLSLLGSRVVFIAGLPILRPHLGLAQALIGFGDRLAVCVTASDSVPQPELYTELLHAAIRQEI